MLHPWWDAYTNTAFGLNSPCFNGTKHLIYGNWNQFKQIYYITNNHFNHIPTVRSLEKIWLGCCFTHMFKNCPKSNIISSSIPTDQRDGWTATTTSLPPLPMCQPHSSPHPNLSKWMLSGFCHRNLPRWSEPFKEVNVSYSALIDADKWLEMSNAHKKLHSWDREMAITLIPCDNMRILFQEQEHYYPPFKGFPSDSYIFNSPDTLWNIYCTKLPWWE